jgi:hypothetical protein
LQNVFGHRDAGTVELVQRWRRSPVTLAMGGWLLVYAVICLTGQRFSTEYLRYGWQLIPNDILRGNPVSSVWYLHTQPPLWNLLLGLIEKLSPLSTGLSLQLLMAGLGAGLAGGCAAIVRGLRLRRGVAVGIALAVTVNSEVIGLAFNPRYELPVACALTWMIAVLLGHRNARRICITLVMLATIVALTRSLYHPIWLVVVAAAALIHFRRSVNRATITVCVVVPLLLVAGGWSRTRCCSARRRLPVGPA